MEKMKKATITANLNSDVQKVWDIVTDNRDYTWRNDLSKIEVSDNEQTFIEYTKNGFPTTFTITLKKPTERYEFDMKNRNMSGHWVGTFSKTETGTQIEFTEELTIKNPIMNLLAGIYIKKQQATYVDNLRKALGE